MSDFKCTRMRRSWFIDRDIVFDIEVDDRFGPLKRIERSVKLRPEMSDLGMAFFRNKIEIRFECDNTLHDADYIQIREQIKDFCDTKLSCHWSWLQKSKRIEDSGMSYQLDLFFECEDALKLFQKECGLLIKLAN